MRVIDPLPNMADKAIKVAVLEDEFASLAGLGFPVSLSIQLQESCLTLSKAQWTAKSTKSGFSVSFFWPTPELKEKQPPRRNRRRRRAKARNLIPATTSKSILKPPSPCIKTNNLPAARESLNNATHRTSPTNISSQDKHGGSLLTHANTTESENGGDTENEQQWTKVSHKRRKVRLPPCWKLRVPVHLRDNIRTSSESASEISDCEESHANDSITHTPVAARTRSKLKT